MICVKCNIEKNIECFEIRTDNNLRRKSCKDCIKLNKKINYEKNKEIILKKNKNYIDKRKDWKKQYDKKRNEKLK